MGIIHSKLYFYVILIVILISCKPIFFASLLSLLFA